MAKLNSEETEIKRLRKENAELKKRLILASGPTVNVPKTFSKIFQKAEQTVGNYFKTLKHEPEKGSIEINGQRYLLIRASALSFDFFQAFKTFYADQGAEEAAGITRNVLFDMAHVIGMEDAKIFHKKMKLKDPVSKLSAGPVHFAYSGWAFVDISEESRPSSDDKYFLKYNHPYSFEADSWLKAGKKSDQPVCIMNAGYSSGWCQESFGIPLTAVEISCRAKGDKHCTFIMAPPDKIEQYVGKSLLRKKQLEIPSFLKRKKTEEQLRRSLHEKEILIKEVHHRVKNNMQIISSLLNLQSSTIKDESVRQKINDSISRIKSMAIIHEMLYQNKDLSHVPLKPFLKALISHISSGYKLNKGVSIQLKTKVIEENIDIDKAIPIGLLVNEIISNSIKHAFTGRTDGKIKVSLDQWQKNKVLKNTLTISDNGNGMKIKSDLSDLESLGLQLIHSLTAQLGGNLTVKTKNGTGYQIEF